MAKTRVNELARQYGVTSKVVLDRLTAIGEFAKTASSSLEIGVVKKFRAAYGPDNASPTPPARWRPSLGERNDDEATAACVRVLLRDRTWTAANLATGAALRGAATRAGLTPREADVWAESAGAARYWSTTAVELIPPCDGVTDLDRFVIRCEIERACQIAFDDSKADRPKATRTQVGAKPAKPRTKAKSTTAPAEVRLVAPRAPKRSRNDQLAEVVRKDNAKAAALAARRTTPLPRLTGAQLPPKPLNMRSGMADHDDRPRGWETTDWISSKS